MKLKLLTAILITGIVFLSACLKDDHFGQSPYNTLSDYVLEGQIGNAIIDQNTGIINCSMDSMADISNLALLSYEISNYASISPDIGEVRDYSDTVDVIVTAENGDSRTYKVVLQEPAEQEQISNSDFQDWYDTGAGYLQPGTDGNNIIWNTANEGAILTGITPTYPEIIGDNDSVAVLETMAVVFGPRIAAGSLFTGLFELNIINPPESIKPGIPFSSRPTAFSLKMKFQPGPENLDGSGNPLPYDDEATLYVLLEVRSGEEVKRLGTAWYRSSDTYTDWHQLEVDMIYGALDNSYPDYMKPANGLYAEADESPTHISVIFSSSAEGDVFAGAVGSKLSVNDFELLYD